MPVDFEEAYPPASSIEISRLEIRAGRELPRDYRTFLERQNGGWLQDNDQALEKIFSLSDTVPDYVNIWHKLEVFSERVPSWLLPVGQDVYGNLFAISLRDSDLGSVWFWDHEEEADEDEPPTEDNLDIRAPGWTDFLQGLQPAS